MHAGVFERNYRLIKSIQIVSVRMNDITFGGDISSNKHDEDP